MIAIDVDGPNPATGPRGFSLLELLMALAIMTLAMAVSVPSFRVWVDNYRLRGAAIDMLDALQLARSEAVRRNQNVVLLFTSNSWQLFVDAGGGGGTGGNFIRDGSELILKTHAAPTGISYQNFTFGGTNAYTGFNSRGMPISGDCVGTVQGRNQGGKTFTIAVSLAGSVTRQ